MARLIYLNFRPLASFCSCIAYRLACVLAGLNFKGQAFLNQGFQSGYFVCLTGEVTGGSQQQCRWS